MQQISPLAWSPLGGGRLPGPAPVASPLSTLLSEVAVVHGVTPSVLALAWLVRHPAGIIPIIGTTNPERIRESVRAAEIRLSREEWYTLLEAARGERLP